MSWQQQVDSMSEAEIAALAKSLTPKWSRYIPYPPKVTTSEKVQGISPKQTAFLLLDDLEAMIGGAAGGGKSEALLIGATQYVDDFPTSSLLLRRSYRDLDKPGGLMFRAREWFTGTDAHWDGINYRWIFPSGATINFGYLDHAGDEQKFQSSEYQYCVQADTLIRVGDGSLKPICEIKAGDFVDTLQGPRPVNKVHNVGVKPVVKVILPHGETVVSSTHPMLTASGWVSPEVLKSIQSDGSHISSESSTGSYQESSQPFLSLLFGQRPVSVLSPQHRRGIDRLETRASSLGGRTSTSTSYDAHRESLPLQEWFGHLMLHEPAVLSAESASSRLPRCEVEYVTTAYGVQGSPSDYQPCCGSCGEQYRPMSTVSPEHIPSRGGVAAATLAPMLTDDPQSTPSHIRQDSYEYSHPYTNLPVAARVGVRQVSARFVPAGEAEVWDLEVAGASHYVTSTGIIAQNCGYDELTHFPVNQYLYLFSRLRRLKGTPVPLRMRSGTNPGGPGHSWVKERWNLPDGPGVDSGRVFIPASLYDNPFLEHEEYAAGLDLLGSVTKAQLLKGDWSATSTGGYFVAEQFRIIPWNELPQARDFLAIIRYWDFAATEPSELNPDPDYTVGVKIGMVMNEANDTPDWYVLDVERFRGHPGTVESRVRAVGVKDGPRVVQWLEQERGAAGKLNFRNYAVNVLPNSVCRPLWATGTKEAKAAVAAARVNEGRVFLMEGPWVDDFVAECAVFPMGSHDDQVDGISNGIVAIDKERHFASSGKVEKVGGMKPVERGRKQSVRGHVGY